MLDFLFVHFLYMYAIRKIHPERSETRMIPFFLLKVNEVYRTWRKAASMEEGLLTELNLNFFIHGLGRTMR
jgi:hypothetical protein